MNINELHSFITEVAEELPEKEANHLIKLRDSLECLGPKEWSYKLEVFANDMLLKNIGNHEKLSILISEAESASSIEIKPINLLLFIVLVIIVVVMMGVWLRFLCLA